MNGEIKTGGEAHRLFHQFLQNFSVPAPLRGVNTGFGFFTGGNTFVEDQSHHPALTMRRGASTERSLELFRAYDYTPRMLNCWLYGFLLAPVIFFVAKLERLSGFLLFWLL